MIQSLLKAYGFDTGLLHVETFGTGLINHTWKLQSGENAYIVQRINEEVFKEPEAIASNINLIATFLQQHFPHYLFAAPIPTREGKDMFYDVDHGYFRVFPFVANSHSIDVVETPAQAYEAAVQFGKFSKLLSGIDLSKLKITIPGFHDLSLRYTQFLHALEQGNKKRIHEAAAIIKTLQSFSAIVSVYDDIVQNTSFKLRVTHHDTKISNVLFDAADKGLCVIDLDTVMPGYFISDVGDMIRTYVCPVSEEEKDFSKICVRPAFYNAIVDGYYSEMKDELTPIEKQYFLYAGKYIIYMQAIRFLTDHLNDDAYYGANYRGQNLVRAGNQTVLLQRLFELNPDGEI